MAREVMGLDNSEQIPPDGVRTGPKSLIIKGDGATSDVSIDVDIIVAGEFIEHIENPLEFFRSIRRRYPGREMVISTPNGTSLANTLLGIVRREAQHPDHLQIFTFKILNTLCQRVGFPEWEIIPYHFQATDMILNSRGAKRAAAIVVQWTVGLMEWLFPLLSCGYILKARL